MNIPAVFKTLEGYKTYLIAALAIAYLIWCKHAGHTPDETILAIFASLGLAAVRHGNKTDLDRFFVTASSEQTELPAVPAKPAGYVPPGERGFAVRPVLFALAGITVLALVLTGCMAAVKQHGNIVSVTQSVIGIDIAQDANSSSPHLRLGYIRSQAHVVPTGSNIYAPAVLSSMSLDNTFGHQKIDEDFATGGATRDFSTNSPTTVSARTRTPKSVPPAAPNTNAPQHSPDVLVVVDPGTNAPGASTNAPPAPAAKSTYLGTYMGMRSYDDKQGGVVMASETSGQVLRWISRADFDAIYVNKTKPEYPTGDFSGVPPPVAK